MGKVPKLLLHIINPDSRKVGFGWQVFIVSTWLLYAAKISADQWQGCVLLAGFLIGGGTLGDKWMEVRNGKPADPVAP